MIRLQKEWIPYGPETTPVPAPWEVVQIQFKGGQIETAYYDTNLSSDDLPIWVYYLPSGTEIWHDPTDIHATPIVAWRPLQGGESQ